MKTEICQRQETQLLNGQFQEEKEQKNKNK
jgi:hypothetical protein